jgi:hypothetical protein
MDVVIQFSTLLLAYGISISIKQAVNAEKREKIRKIQSLQEEDSLFLKYSRVEKALPQSLSQHYHY